MSATFAESLESAVTKCGTDNWLQLKPAEQAAAIYREMRRLDAEAVARRRLHAAQQDVPVDASLS
jgi:hypothetical protein